MQYTTEGIIFEAFYTMGYPFGSLQEEHTEQTDGLGTCLASQQGKGPGCRSSRDPKGEWTIGRKLDQIRFFSFNSAILASS